MKSPVMPKPIKKKAATPKKEKAAKPPVAGAKKPAAGAPRAPRGLDELDAVLADVRPIEAVKEEMLDEWLQVDCPFCGEAFEIHATSEEKGQTLYQDCDVCCRPISMSIQVEEGELQIEAHRS